MFFNDDGNVITDETSLIYNQKKSKLCYGSIKPRGSNKYQSQYGDLFDQDKTQENYHKKSGLFSLFRHSTKYDRLLMFIGLIFSLMNGASLPIMALVFGQMTNTFIIIQTHQSSENNTSIYRDKQAVNSNGSSIHGFADYLDRNNKLNDFGSFITDNEDVIKLENLSIYNTNTTNIPLSFNGFNEFNSLNSTSLPNDELTERVVRYSLYYLYIAIGVFIASFIQTLCWETAAERQVQHLHELYFGQVLRQDISWYDLRTKENGNLTTKLSDDLERIREGIGSKFSLVTQYISTFFTGIAVGLLVNWHLTIVILCAGPILVGSSAYLAKVSASTSAREQLKYSLAGGVAEEALNGIKTVAAFGGEIKEISRYEKALEEGRKMAMKKYYWIACIVGGVFALMYFIYGLALYYGANLIGSGISTPGSVFTVLFSVMTGAFSIGNALPFISSVSGAIGSARDVFNIIDRKPKIDPYSNEGVVPISKSGLKGLIQFNNVYFTYPARPEIKVLERLNLKIEPGKTIALVGTSGAGKSTVIQLLLRFYDPSFGEILLDNINLKNYNISWLRNQIGVVSQEPILFGMSIEENITLGYKSNPDGTTEEVDADEIIKAATLANIHKFIISLPNGYQTPVGEQGAQLSGGQKQRIAIARAIVRDPKILLLDEATSALDSMSEGVVQEALEQAMKGRTTVIVAHRLSTIRNADVIYAFKDGSIGEYGTHDELMLKKGLYYNLVSTHVHTDVPETSCSEDDDGTYLIAGHRYNKGTKKCSANYEKQSLSICKSSNDETDDDDDDDNGFIPYNKNGIIGEKKRGNILWRIFKLNAPERNWLLLGFVGCSLVGISTPTFAFFYGEIFRTFMLVGEELRSSAIFWTKMFSILSFVGGISYIMQIIGMTTASEKLIVRLRLMAFQNILKQSIDWFENKNNSPGVLITKLARDAPMIKHAVGMNTCFIISSGVTMIAGLTISLIYGWKLTCILLVLLPLLIGASYKQAAIVRQNHLRDMNNMDDAGKIASDCVANIRTVQSLNKEKLFLKYYTNFLIEPFREAKKQAVFYSLVFCLSQSVIYLLYSLSFRFGAYLISIGEMKPDAVYKVFFSIAFCSTATGQAAAYTKDYFKGKLALKVLLKLINTKSKMAIDSSIGIKPEIRGKITFNSVHFKYPTRPEVDILKGVSFTVEPGKTLALVGSSGCGKSTIVSILERFYDLSRGSVMIDNFPLQTINVRYLRSKIGLVTQEPALFDCSIKDNILYGLENNKSITMDDVIKAARYANIHKCITSLPKGYDTLVGGAGGGGGCKLSGGQKQRIAIARALIRDPKILLLDEATSALDTESEMFVQEALDRARQGRTCIIIAHRLSTIRNADSISVLQNGVIVEQGTHEELLSKHQIYYELIKRQNL